MPIAVAMAIASGRAQQPTPRPHPADEAPHGAGSVVVLDPGLKELTHGGLLLLGLPWARASNRGRQAVSGNPELAPGSKELAPEERGAVKILHAGLLLQGLPPASTRKDRRLWERGVAAPDRKAASEARKHRTDGLEIEGAGARGAW